MSSFQLVNVFNHFDTSGNQTTNKLIDACAKFCETRLKMSVEVFRGRNLDRLPSTNMAENVTDVTDSLFVYNITSSIMFHIFNPTEIAPEAF